MDRQFGGIGLEEIENASNTIPFPDNAGASPSERFVLKISTLVTTRQQQGESGGYSVFLRSDSLNSDAHHYGGDFVPLIATGNDPISEKIWLSNATLGGAYSKDISGCDAAKIFALVEETGLPHLPALIIDWRGDAPVGRFYPNGLSDMDNVQEVQLAYEPITEVDLKACLDSAHRTSLATPQRVSEGHAEKIWNDAAKGWPASRAEERIQGKIIQHLRARYTKHVVRAERKNDEGRLDLLIFARTNDVGGNKVVVNEWILELKALTDRTDSGGEVKLPEVRKRVSDGLIQAIAYRNDEHAQNAALCCYDMRKDDEGDDNCFQEIRVDAEKEAIRLWRWILHRTTKKAREEQYAASAS